ncbi:MAG: AraC family transcriptional regulator [Paenibacillaceae bacterium]|nr:AraC family transcriptional regulator [Paenibacillaceae bacterium]
MRVWQTYKSKRYLVRIILTVSFLFFLLLTIFSFVFFRASENIIVNMQHDNNKKVLSQIDFNMTYMNGMIQNLGLSLLYDNDLIQMMNGSVLDSFEISQRREKISTFAKYASFIHSIVVYNGVKDQFIWGGDSAMQDPAQVYYANLRHLLSDGKSIQNMKLTPMSLHENGQVDLFSAIYYDGITYKAGQSVVVVNMKTQWLFDNIAIINKLSEQESENVLIMDHQGAVISPDSTFRLDDNMRTKLLQVIDSEHTGYFIYRSGRGNKVINYMNAGIDGWKIISIQPYEALVGKVDRLQQISIVLTAVFLLLALLTSFITSLRLYRPVGKLFTIMQRDTEAGEAAEIRGNELTYMSTMYKRTIEQLNSLKKEQMSTHDAVRSYYMGRLVQDSPLLTETQFADIVRANKFNISPEGPYLQCVMKIDQLKELAASYREKRLFLFAIANISQEFIAPKYACETVEMKNDLLHMVISTFGQEQAHIHDDLKIRFAKAMSVVKKLYHITFSVSISDTIPHSSAMNAHYQIVSQNLLYTLAFGNESIIVPSMVAANMNNMTVHLPGELEKKLVESVKSNQAETFDKLLGHIFDHVASLNYDYMIYMVLHVCILIRHAANERSENKIAAAPIDFSHVISRIVEGQSLHAIRCMLMDVFREVHAKPARPEEDRNEILIETIKEVITSNYTNLNLGLQEIGDVMKMSPAYIGKLFKRSQGLSIAEYINEVRLQYAVHYLKSGTYTINDIIEKVGFGNRGNFFRLFKNKYGTTPKEYRTKKSMLD